MAAKTIILLSLIHPKTKNPLSMRRIKISHLEILSNEYGYFYMLVSVEPVAKFHTP